MADFWKGGGNISPERGVTKQWFSGSMVAVKIFLWNFSIILLPPLSMLTTLWPSSTIQFQPSLSIWGNIRFSAICTNGSYDFQPRFARLVFIYSIIIRLPIFSIHVWKVHIGVQCEGATENKLRREGGFSRIFTEQFHHFQEPCHQWSWVGWVWWLESEIFFFS